LDRGDQQFWEVKEGTSLYDFYIGTFSQRLIYHQEQGRGLLPSGADGGNPR